MKRKFILLFVLIFALAFPCSTYAQTLYEFKTVTPVYTGLNYEQSRRVTSNGLLDVHVLTVDLDQDHLEVRPVASGTENGLKEQLTRMLEQSGAVAGINGDFFGLAGSHDSASTVPEWLWEFSVPCAPSPHLIVQSKYLMKVRRK